ncbi:MAG TPA: type II secretion system F family protein [Actinomycetota bacterium]|nr:type II secretion system F family protein [Actinomycetota bacterium]
MSEVLLALLAGATVWFALGALPRKDPVVAGRVGVLTGGQPRMGRKRPVGALLGYIGRSYPGAATETNRELLAAAGLSKGSVETVRGAQLALGAAGFVAGLVTGPMALVASPVGMLVGYRIPRTFLVSRSKRRKEEMAAGLPDVVDLLAVCSHAGLNISLSLKRVALRAPGTLGREIQRVVEEIDLGVPRSQALESFAARSGLPEIESLVRVLINSERFGTQISASLETFSADLRARRKRSAEEQARRAPVKILFPLVFLILPAFILLTVVPLLVSAFESMDF